jgi:hypothetical protein
MHATLDPHRPRWYGLGIMAGKDTKRSDDADAATPRDEDDVRPSEGTRGDRREKQTLIPAFDPARMAMDFEVAADRPTITPPYDASSYARIVDEHVGAVASGAGHDTPRTITAALPVGGYDDANSEHAIDRTTSGTLGRAMYGSYLQSDYPEAMVLAERVLEREPDHALAKLVFEGCRARLGPSEVPRLVPSSVVRLKRPAYEVAELAQLESDVTSQIVLGHVDGVADVAMLAELAGIPRPDALERLHALLELGMLEVVNG